MSLVDKWGGVGADGNFPAAHEVEAEQAQHGFGLITCSLLSVDCSQHTRFFLFVREKKKEILGPPPFRAPHPSGGPHFGAPPFGA